MAEDKITKGMMTSLLREMKKSRGDDSAAEKVASEAAAKAREGRGLIGGLLASEKAKIDVAKEYSIATKGTLGKRQAFFEGLLGRDLEGLFKNLNLEKMESPETIKEAREKFKLDKKGKGERDGATSAAKSVGRLSKPISLILRKVIETQKLIQKIQQNIAKPASGSKYIFDPRMAGGGRFRDVTTNKLVSSKVALEDGGIASKMSRTDALTAAINADETPLVKLREFLEFKFKDFDAQKLNKQLSGMDSKLDMILLAVGASAVSDILDDVDILDRNKKNKPGPPGPGKPPGKPDVPKKGKFGRVGEIFSKAGKGIAGAASKAGTAIAGAGSAAAGMAAKAGAGAAGLASKAAAAAPALGTAAKVAGKFAAPVAVGMTAYDAYQAGSNAEQTLGIEGREATIGETAAAGVGGAVEGLTFGMVSAKTVGTGLVSAGEAVSGATSKALEWASGKTRAVANLFGGSAPRLDQVTTKQNAGVDTSGLQSGMQDRLARMAEAFKEVTGKKLMLTSGYRSDDKQMKLWTSKYNEIKAANPNATEDQLIKMTRKWVALPAALGGKGSPHGRGTAVDINSKGAAGIEAINGMTFNGQKVTTDSFLAMFGLKRPLGHEPWHIQPLEGAPVADNPDPNAKPLVADEKGNAINLETGKSESIPPPAPMVAQSGKGELPPVSDSASAAPVYAGKKIEDKLPDSGATPAAGLGPAGQPRGEGMKIEDRLADSGVAPVSPGLGPAGQPRGPGMQIPDSGSITPVASTVGTQVAEGSVALETSKMTAQATPPAPVVINNNQGGNQQPITPPKTPLPKASSRSSENSFNRALAKDFSHPTAFTSVGVI